MRRGPLRLLLATLLVAPPAVRAADDWLADTVEAHGVGAVLEAPAIGNRSWQRRQAAGDRAFLALPRDGSLDWEVLYDERTGRPWLLRSSGLPLLEAAEASGESARERVVSSARDFLRASTHLHGLEADELTLAFAQPAGDLWTVIFDRTAAGIPVEGSRVTLALVRGRLTLARFERLVEVELDPLPTLTPDAARLRGLEWTGERGAVVLSGPELVFVPGVIEASADRVIPGSRGYELRLAYKLGLRLEGSPGTWMVYVDAHAGEVFRLFDANLYTSGEVAAMVRDRSHDGPELRRPLADAQVLVGGTVVSTDSQGRYTSSGSGDVLFELMSSQATGGFDILNVGGPDSSVHEPAAPVVDLTWSRQNSRSDERSAFYHLMQVRQRGLRHNRLPWYETVVPAEVNHDLVCNAYWAGSGPAYFRAGCLEGAGDEIAYCCNNTGEIADIIYHEWGHGLDSRNGGLADATSSEAISDITAFHMTHDAIFAPGFLQQGWYRPVVDNPSAMRDVSKPVTVANIAERCENVGRCKGPLGYQCHCEAMILAGAVWDLQAKLGEKHGDAAGWLISERLHYLAMPLWGNYLGAYDAYLFIDDVFHGDRNLLNGTPNGCLIYEAFAAHGIATDPAVCSDPLVRLTITSQAVDDTGPGGDGDRTADPGERVGLVFAVRNVGKSVTGSATVTVSSSTPGVMPLGSATIPPLSPGSEGVSQPPYTLILSSSLPCGALVPLEVVLEADGMRRVETMTLQLGRPVATLVRERFEAGSGDFTGDEGTASDGQWVVGRPEVTARYGDLLQPDGCAEGQGCLYTGRNPAWYYLEAGDVDGGEAVATSGPVDLNLLSSPVLRYDRWFVSLAVADQPDFFEVRLDAGAESVLLQRVDLSRSAWVADSVSLSAVQPPAGQARLEFVAIDAGDDNLVEAALDHVRLQEFDCRVNPWCVVSELVPDSLRVAKDHEGGAVALAWDGSGPTGFIVHATSEPELIRLLWEEPETRLGWTRSAPYLDASPVAEPVFYQVHPTDCRQASLP